MNEPRPKRVAVYARVSTDDKGQAPENQLRELRAWCDHAGHTIVAGYVEHESGGKSLDYRRQFAAVFEDASRRKFGLLVRAAVARGLGHADKVTASSTLETLAADGQSSSVRKEAAEALRRLRASSK